MGSGRMMRETGKRDDAAVNGGKRGRREGHVDGGRPAPLLAHAVRGFLRLWFLPYRLHVDRTGIRGLKPPYILIVNHPSNLDAFIVARCLPACTANYVASAYFYRYPLLRFLLGRVGAIPKLHSTKDLNALRLMRGVLAHGRILVVFPEGRRSLEGRGSRFSEALAKFAKKSGVPVVAASIRGSYHAWPRWSKTPRPAPVSIRFTTVMTPVMLAAQPVEAIHLRMLDALRFNEYDHLPHDGGHYRWRKPAAHIEWLLHLCPDCGRDLAIRGERRTMTCRFCGASAVFGRDGSLQRRSGVPEPWPQVPAWFDRQRAGLAERMRDEAFCLLEPGTLLRMAEPPKATMVFYGSGSLRLTRDGLTFEAQPGRQVPPVSFPLASLDLLPVSLGHHLEICDVENVYWQFRPEQPEAVIRIEQYVDIALHGPVSPVP